MNSGHSEFIETMQEINDTPVFQKSYDLYKIFYVMVRKYPKGDRYSLGEKTKEKTLDLMEAVVKAGHAKRDWKATFIEQAIAALETVKILVRLGYETQCLHQKQYIEVESRIQEIGRMLGGWKKSV